MGLRNAALLTVAGLVTVLAACSDDSPSQPAADPADGTYVAAVCSAFAAEKDAPSVDASGIADSDRYVQILRQAIPPADLTAGHGQMIAALDEDLTQLKRGQAARLGMWELRKKPACTPAQATQNPLRTWCYDPTAATRAVPTETLTDMQRSRRTEEPAIRPLRAFPAMRDAVRLRLVPLVKADSSCQRAGVTAP